MAEPGKTTATVALLVAVVAVSWSAILIRWSEAPALGIAFYRLLFSTLIILPWGFRKVRPVTRKTVALSIAAGALLALHFATWISSLTYTSVASSVVLVATTPVFTAILAPVFLGEKPGKRGFIAIFLCVGGVVILAGGDFRMGGAALVGDLLALAGAVTASLYFMIGRNLREMIRFPAYLLLVYGAAAVVLGFLALGGSIRLGGYPGLTWLCIVGMAVGPNLLGHGLFNWSLRRLRALTVNMAILGEPVLATFYAALIFSEHPGITFYAGAVLIVAGILLSVSEERMAA